MNITINLINGEITSYDASSISMNSESGQPILIVDTINGDVVNLELEQIVSFQIQMQAKAMPAEPAKDDL